MNGVPHEGEPSPDDPLLALMLSDPPMMERVLAAHVERADGKCADCSGYRSREWPCVHYWYAELALRVLGKRVRRGRT